MGRLRHTPWSIKDAVPDVSSVCVCECESVSECVRVCVCVLNLHGDLI